MIRRFIDLPVATKFILSLLATSLVSTAVVGGVAYSLMTRKFNDLAQEETARAFSADVSTFFHTYGTWEEGRVREGFRNFTDRRRAAGGAGLGRLASPPPANASQRPRFRFYLFDTHFRSLIDLEPYRYSDNVLPTDKPHLKPIESDGRVVAHYSPINQQPYSGLDLAYVAAMRDSLIIGVVTAALLALLLGTVFGKRLSQRLNQLTRAAHAMEQGNLRQHVAVTGHDEIGELAEEFNRMSGTLATNYQDLQESHEQIRQQAEQLRELSVHDALTNLYNRRYFDEQGAVLFERAVRYNRPLSVVIADIDHFKKVNDTYSHATGDEVLRRIGELLSAKARATDLVARYGGEEFVIAFPETPLAQATATCEMLRQRIESYAWHTLHADLKVTISMGVCANTRLKSIGEMVDAADKLLYQAKQSGRNRVCSA